jgi:hypothetical protein
MDHWTDHSKPYSDATARQIADACEQHTRIAVEQRVHRSLLHCHLPVYDPGAYYSRGYHSSGRFHGPNRNPKAISLCHKSESSEYSNLSMEFFGDLLVLYVRHLSGRVISRQLDHFNGNIV